MQKIEAALTIDGMATEKIFDPGEIGFSKRSVESADAGILVGDPLVASDSVVVASLDEKRTGKNQSSEVSIVKGVAHVPIRHFPQRIFIRRSSTNCS